MSYVGVIPIAGNDMSNGAPGYCSAIFWSSSFLNDCLLLAWTTVVGRNPEGLCCRLTIPCPRKYHPPVQFRAFEVNRESITTVRSLGHGSFGEVWLAKWNGSVEVAVKMRLENTDRARFIEEARLMHTFHHPRIVQLLGVCTQPEDQPVYIITELMRNGALVDFLRREEGRRLELNDLIDMMAQASSTICFFFIVYTAEKFSCLHTAIESIVQSGNKRLD
ncbi:unnamed protein product [Echinostoma caproni]|uniref:Protein kinase domain-containing protein n=1 Tax=Echinostoma caproni TaxID=27848 RepID=A0A183ARD9_9TREM|nr:unnamed protein product [Echinostoma caproni]